MKMRVFVCIACVLLMFSCVSSPSETKQASVADISAGEGSIFDINNGSNIGSFIIKAEEKETVIDVTIGATKAVSTYDGSKDFLEYSGTFKLLENFVYRNNRIVKFVNTVDPSIILLLTTYSNKMIPAAMTDSSEGENYYTVSIMSKDTADLVLNKSDKNYNPVFAVYAVKTFMISQAILMQ